MRRVVVVASLIAIALAGRAQAQSFQVIYRFPTADCCAYSRLVQGSDLKLYGTNLYAPGQGGIFRLNTDGSAFQFIHSFDGATGASPVAGLILGKDGYFYGTTRNGGLPGSFYGGNGVVFRVSADGSQYNVVHYLDISEGYAIFGPAAQDSAGTLYSTAAFNEGIIYKVQPSGAGFQILHTFNGADGERTDGPVVIGGDGRVYGGTHQGGAGGQGNLFRVNADGTGFQVLHSFVSGEGLGLSDLFQGTDGALYGASDVTLFRINPDGTGYQILHTLNLPTEGGAPSLLQASDGALYIANNFYGPGGNGTLCTMQTDGTGFAVLHVFNPGPSDGGFPSGVIQAQDGNLYGTSIVGGATTPSSFDFTGTVWRYSLSTLSIDPPALAPTTELTFYNNSLSVNGSSGFFLFSVTAGALPPGISLSPFGGMFGFPTAVGTYNFTVTASDGVSTVSRAYSLLVDYIHIGGGVALDLQGAAFQSTNANPDGSASMVMTDANGGAYSVAFPPGTLPIAPAPAVVVTLIPSSTVPAIRIQATLPAGATKQVTLPRGAGTAACVIDTPGAQLGGTCPAANVVNLPAPGTLCVAPDPACAGLAPGQMILTDSSDTQITVSGLANTVVEMIHPDSDGDGVLDVADWCPGTDRAGPIPTVSLLPGHLGDAEVDALGCNASQILGCKPGHEYGEQSFGVTAATDRLFQTIATAHPTGWASACAARYPRPSAN